MTDTEMKLLRLVMLIFNRKDVYKKMATKIEFVEAVMLVAPIMDKMTYEQIHNLRKRLI